MWFIQNTNQGIDRYKLCSKHNIYSCDLRTMQMEFMHDEMKYVTHYLWNLMKYVMEFNEMYGI